jgi:hypothetical protein
MKSIIVIFGALLLIISLPTFFQATYDARTQEQTLNLAGVTTAAGVYSANVTLTQATHDGKLAAVQTVSSNVTSDSPTGAAYNSVSKVLNVTGLDASQTRTLSIAYDIDSTLIPDGVSIFLTLCNWFYIFAILGCITGAVYSFFD